MPIAYATKRSQLAQDLAMYKSPRPSEAARTRLSALIRVFLREHRGCLVEAAGGQFTHYCVVPSTSGRSGTHPLHHLIQLSLPHVTATTNGAHQGCRSFHKERFTIADQLGNARVLVLDDTWASGSRIRGLSHALKQSGALATVAVVIGRHLNPVFSPNATVIDSLGSKPFDIGHCCLEDS